MKLIHGDCLEKLKELPDSSVDSVVTDPPYGLSFMGKKWDYDVPSVEIWKECLRVLKPGGHLLSFAGTRTQHRMAVRIEDAGFEIRDMVAWCYGQGFPKSHNLDGNWKGWGTALKPSLEPITVARKPLIGTVAENVQEYGTGAINVDGCRVGTEITKTNGWDTGGDNDLYRENLRTPGYIGKEHTGRWPANLIHDGSEEVVGMFPHTTSGKMGPWNKRTTNGSPNGIYGKFDIEHPLGETIADSGSAARFFYCPKANRQDRNSGGIASNHPTVKPTDLMRYLVRLVTRKGGTVLDPFMGSGSTGKACVLEGMDFIGIEREEEYVRIAEARINNA